MSNITNRSWFPGTASTQASYTVGRLLVHMKAQYEIGTRPVDTQVLIGDTPLCWICWSDREAFVAELNTVIAKYCI